MHTSSPLKLIFLSALLSALSALGAPLAKKGKLILSNPFEGTLERHESVELKDGWTRRISFGIWTLQSDGSLKAINVPEHGHGPVLTFIAPIRDIIIECEFMIPETPIKDRHFRIFIDEDGFRGHNIQSTANLSSSFRPVGFTLQHLRKDDKKGIVKDVDFGPLELDLKPCKWYQMRLEVVGDQARTTVDGITLMGQHPDLNVEKSKIGLNPGLAGGSIRNFKAWKVNDGR